MTREEKLRKSIEHLRTMHAALVDIEVQIQMELVGSPADSGFSEACDDVRENWSRFVDLLEVD